MLLALLGAVLVLASIPATGLFGMALALAGVGVSALVMVQSYRRSGGGRR